jgi:hypothetical protein
MTQEVLKTQIEKERAHEHLALYLVLSPFFIPLMHALEASRVHLSRVRRV